MVGSFLRKRRPAPSSSEDSPRGLNHSLSLPDLITPLIDPGEWEELPPIKFDPTHATSSQGVQGAQGAQSGRKGQGIVRGRKPSLVGVAISPGGRPGTAGSSGSPVQFHRPLPAWQVVDSEEPDGSTRPRDSVGTTSSTVPGPQTLGGAQSPPIRPGVSPIPSPRGAVPPVPVPIPVGSWLDRPPHGDFRTSHTLWGRDSVVSQNTHGSSSTVMGRSGYSRRRKGKSKVANKLNIVVVGGKGVGKTSFINLLMSSFDTDSSRRQETVTETAPSRPRMDSLSPQAATGPLADSTPNSPTVPGPPTAFLDPTSLGVPIGSFRPPSSTASQPSTTPHSPISPATPTFPANTTSTRIAPTTRMSSRVSTVHLDGYERHELRVVDTPGLELGDDDPVKERERERGMMGLMRLLEERFEEVMREESRIVRRGTKGEDNLIHLVLYLIDAREVLRPKVDGPPKVDWSCVGVFDTQVVDLAGAPPISEPCLQPTVVSVIQRLATRSHVLPVLAQTDALTISELDRVQSAVRRDLSSLPGAGFGLFGGDPDGTSPNIDTPTTSPARPTDPRPPTPASTVDSDSPMAALPYAIFSPELTIGPTNNTPPSFVRSFAWGQADVMDPDQSNFLRLREAVLGVHAKALRTTTREVLYEKFRTERLLAKQGQKGHLSADRSIS